MRKPESLKSSDRRSFLKVGGAAVLGAAAIPTLASAQGAASATPSSTSTASASNSMPTRNLGKTGYKVGIFSLGGQAALERGQQLGCRCADHRSRTRSRRQLHRHLVHLRWPRALERAVRWQGDEDRRNEAFLATKTKERTREGSMRMIEKSLQLLQTDHVDLWQLHDVGTTNDVDAIFAKGGAMEALLEMQQQKVVRYLGITGHYRPEALIECIYRHNFDAILMAMNAADPHHYSFTEHCCRSPSKSRWASSA